LSHVEIKVGGILGRGGFCTVTELLEVDLKGGGGGRHEKAQVINRSSSLISIQDRAFISKHCDRDGQCRYAIKRLSENLITKSKSRFVAGVVDLAMEAKYLSILQHPHIIKLRGMSNSHPCSDTFFVVLDRLYDTLTERMVSWKKTARRMSGLGSVRDFNGNKKEEQLGMRLIVAYDIGSALSFLHQNK